jgi:hypothetical protein
MTQNINNTDMNKEARTHNSRFAKAGVSCFYESEVLNSSFVHLMKFSAENPRLRKAAFQDQIQIFKLKIYSFPHKAFLC